MTKKNINSLGKKKLSTYLPEKCYLAKKYLLVFDRNHRDYWMR